MVSKGLVDFVADLMRVCAKHRYTISLYDHVGDDNYEDICKELAKIFRVTRIENGYYYFDVNGTEVFIGIDDNGNGYIA